jgi:L-lactate dehydrogenase complex protein LldG
MSRESILQAVKKSQPSGRVLPKVPSDLSLAFEDNLSKFTEVLTGIGGRVIPVYANDKLENIIPEAFEGSADILSVSQQVSFGKINPLAFEQPHFLSEIHIALMDVQFGVAENGAVWVTEAQYKIRALPFICSHLAVLLRKKDIVPDMHAAYQCIGSSDYGFGLFIAGPSKTADIEQSLVLGAHGPKSMTVFVMEE